MPALLVRSGFANHRELAQWTRDRIPPGANSGHGHDEAGCINKANVYDLFEKEFNLTFSEAMDLYNELLSAGFVKDYYQSRLNGIGVVLDTLLSLVANTGGGDWVEHNYQCTAYSTPEASKE